MRRRTLILVVVALAAALALAAAALAGPRDPTKQLKPREQAIAKAIVLKRADLPPGTWKATPSSGSGGNLTCPGFNPDQSDLVENGSADSPDFDAQTSFVSSTASIFATSKMAQQAWDRIVRPQLAHCLAVLFKQGVGSGAKVAVVSSGALAFPKLTDRTHALRLVAKVTTSGVTIPASVDVVLLHHGRADIALLVAGIGQPMAPAVEQGLARKLAARLAAVPTTP